MVFAYHGYFNNLFIKYTSQLIIFVVDWTDLILVNWWKHIVEKEICC